MKPRHLCHFVFSRRKQTWDFTLHRCPIVGEQVRIDGTLFAVQEIESESIMADFNGVTRRADWHRLRVDGPVTELPQALSVSTATPGEGRFESQCYDKFGKLIGVFHLSREMRRKELVVIDGNWFGVTHTERLFAPNNPTSRVILEQIQPPPPSFNLRSLERQSAAAA